MCKPIQLSRQNKGKNKTFLVNFIRRRSGDKTAKRCKVKDSVNPESVVIAFSNAKGNVSPLKCQHW